MFNYNNDTTLRDEIIKKNGKIDENQGTYYFTINFEGLQELIDNNFIDPNIRVNDDAPSVSYYVKFYETCMKKWKDKEDIKSIKASGKIINSEDSKHLMYVNFIDVVKNDPDPGKKDNTEEEFSQDFIEEFEIAFPYSEILVEPGYIYSAY